jgi:hypothetical protein
VFRAFFFFLGCALVVAHRIDWYGIAAIREASGLEAAIEHVDSLLNGAISDRGCAIEPMPMQLVVAMCQKFGRRFGRAKALVVARRLHIVHFNPLWCIQPMRKPRRKFHNTCQPICCFFRPNHRLKALAPATDAYYQTHGSPQVLIVDMRTNGVEIVRKLDTTVMRVANSSQKKRQTQKATSPRRTPPVGPKPNYFNRRGLFNWDRWDGEP